jgi:flagellar basal body-associated protein FliL
LKPAGSKSSNYKIPIIIGVVLIVAVIGGIIAFSGGGGQADTTNASDVGIEIEYVGIAGDGESYYVYGSVPPELSNSSKAVIHTDYYDDSGKIIKSDELKLKKFDGNTLDACLVGKEKVAKVVVELRDANGNVLSSAESDNIK